MNGSHTLNVSAANRHSEYVYGHVKYVHNASRVVNVQMAVKDWELEYISHSVRDWDGDFLKFVLFSESICKKNPDINAQIVSSPPLQVALHR